MSSCSKLVGGIRRTVPGPYDLEPLGFVGGATTSAVLPR